MKATFLLVFAGGAFCAALPLFAQQAPPPAVLQLIREDIKEGKGGAHEKSEAAFMQAAARMKFPASVLGMIGVSGPSEAVFLMGHDSFATLGKVEEALNKPEFAALDAIDGELRSGSRSLIAVYRADISYNVDKANLPKSRFFSIETIRIREGQGRAFTDLAKLVISAATKAGDPSAVATYEVVSGAPSGTYVLLQPMESLDLMDQNKEIQRSVFRAMGEDGVAQYTKAVSQTIVNQESVLFAIAPTMSYVPKAWIEADPDFWKPKPAKSTKAPVKAPEKTASN